VKTSQVIAVFVNNYSSAAATTPAQKPLGKTLILYIKVVNSVSVGILFFN